MQDLFRMYNSGTIDAPCDGTISGVDKDSPHLLAAETDKPLQANLLMAETQSWSVVLLSNAEPAPADIVACDPTLGKDCPETDLTKHHPDCLKYCHNNAICDGIADHYPACIQSCKLADGAIDCGRDPGYCHKWECIKSCTHGSSAESCTKDEKHPHFMDCIKSCVQSNGTKDCPATKHYAGCIEICTRQDLAGQCPGSQHHYLDCIEACITSKSGSNFCPSSKHNENCYFASMTYKAKVAIVTAVGSSELVVRWDASGQEYEVEQAAGGWKFVANPDFNVDLLVASGPNVAVSNPKAYKVGDVIFVITGYKNKQPEWSGISVFMRISGNADLDLDLDGLVDGLMDSLAGSLSDMMMSQMDLSALMGMFSGFGNFGFYAPPPVEEDKLFDLEGSTLMTVSPQETVSLTITLDEQDIAKVSVGQKATVKVEALSGEIFEAEVTEVSLRGSNSGGSSKFTAKVELPKVKDMLDGMSASAALPLLEKQDIPTIPVVALVEEGTRTMVYTALDKEGTPTSPVPVTIGISDGITAEILEGLAVGDSYYYSYYDVLEENTGVEERFTLT